MSKQRLRAASQSCTGTVDAAMEEKREGINQWGLRTSSARMGSLQMAPVWAAQQVTDAYRDAHLPLSPSFFQALSLLTTMPGGYFFPALPWLDLSPTPAHILPQTIVSFQADERRHSPTTLLPKSMLSGGANSSSSASEHAGCIAQSLHTVWHQRARWCLVYMDQESEGREVTGRGQADSISSKATTLPWPK